MKRNLIMLIVIGIAFGAGTIVGVLGILWSTGGLSEPSRDTSAAVPTLDLNAPSPTPNDIQFVATQLVDLNEKVDSLSTQVASASQIIVTPMADSATETGIVPDPARALYRITETGSEARFQLEEHVLGTPNLVVGTTSRVAGDIIIDFTNPAASQLGEIAINARTFRTDDEFRDQSIRGQILESSNSDYEFIYFRPSGLTSLPDTAVYIGDSVEFQIIGDLLIRDISNEVTFDVQVTVNEESIQGLALTTLAYADFGITINPPPGIGDIDETVLLELEFTAELIEAQ